MNIILFNLQPKNNIEKGFWVQILKDFGLIENTLKYNSYNVGNAAWVTGYKTKYIRIIQNWFLLSLIKLIWEVMYMFKRFHMD